MTSSQLELRRSAAITWRGSLDGAHALACIQWTSNEALAAYGRSHVPGVVASEVGRYHLVRRLVP